jgi:hypothetical protein
MPSPPFFFSLPQQPVWTGEYLDQLDHMPHTKHTAQQVQEPVQNETTCQCVLKSAQGGSMTDHEGLKTFCHQQEESALKPGLVASSKTSLMESEAWETCSQYIQDQCPFFILKTYLPMCKTHSETSLHMGN